MNLDEEEHLDSRCFSSRKGGFEDSEASWAMCLKKPSSQWLIIDKKTKIELFSHIAFHVDFEALFAPVVLCQCYT